MLKITVTFPVRCEGACSKGREESESAQGRGKRRVLEGGSMIGRNTW